MLGACTSATPAILGSRLHCTCPSRLMIVELLRSTVSECYKSSIVQAGLQQLSNLLIAWLCQNRCRSTMLHSGVITSSDLLSTLPWNLSCVLVLLMPCVICFTDICASMQICAQTLLELHIIPFCNMWIAYYASMSQAIPSWYKQCSCPALDLSLTNHHAP